jgi:hypothetical protein
MRVKEKLIEYSIGIAYNSKQAGKAGKEVKS